MAYRHNPRSTVSALAFLFGASACLLGACGGRSRTIIDGDAAPSAGANSAGAPNVGRAGAASGGEISAGGATAAGGGSSSQGGTGNQCNNVNCALPQCAAGDKLVTLPGSCCPVCQPACTPAPGCPAVACGPGLHSETLAGTCCPVCVDDPLITCDDGKQSYAQQRAALLQKYRYGCHSDADCVVLAPFNRCENGCQYEAVWYGAADFFTSNLADYAATNCASCMLGPIPPCEAPQTPECVGGQCMFGILK